MGCAICLDDFDQADGEAKRATALTCGHIFHFECLNTWFHGATATAVNRPNHRPRCPLCAGAADPSRMVKLFPSDGDDLDKYLSGQQQWEWENLQGDDAVDDANLKQLLADLMDFNTAVQSYVMATHSLNYETMLKSGVKVRKLLIDLNKDTRADRNDALLKSMDALENAASCFSTMFNDLSRRCRNNRQLQATLQKERAEIKAISDKAKDTNKIAEGKLREVDAKSREVSERMERANAQMRQNTETILYIRSKEEALIAMEQRLLADKRKLHLETNIALTNSRQKTEAELQQMRIQVDQALLKSAAAEKERQAAHNKSCQLAEQLQQMQQRLKGRKKGTGSGPLNAVVDDNEAMQRRMKALEARNRAMEDLLRRANITTPELRLARNSQRRIDASSIDLTRSSSPLGNDLDPFPATPLDGVDLGSQASSSTAAAAAASLPSAQRKGKKKARLSLSVEPEQLDDEMDEALFPMPGFGGLQMPGPLAPRPDMLNQSAQGSGLTEATQPTPWKILSDPSDRMHDLLVVGASNSAASAPAAANERKSPGRKEARGNHNGKKRKRSSISSGASTTSNASGTSNKTNKYDWLNKNNGIAFGPKRRSKAT
ncbi:conserved hypothetical protein [Sporisorium reilianum SRZ2]|uniref:RING-type domain-containing protein n=1 Tax=Sporisorium reilianum (strain SRZ2) TaxID=999809 RepID=E6ZSA4_SPORE|nr:conserved hypothetical protein [Sporisorium reilianum SRZ2]